MNAETIIEMLSTEGLTVTLAGCGKINVKGEKEAFNRCQSLLKQHKSEIVSLLMSKEPVEAVEVTGLPCGGCGSTRYTKVMAGYIFPDCTRMDGWHCGTPTCRVKLLTGNPEVDQMHTKPAPEVSVPLSR